MGKSRSSARLLVLDAGAGASSNLVRSLKGGGSSIFVVGCSESAFSLEKSTADRKYQLPPLSRNFLVALLRIAEREHIDLIIPTSDLDVLRLSDIRDDLGHLVFLPSPAVIARCQDKYALSVFLRELNIPAPLTHAIAGIDGVEDAFARFKGGKKLWCRIRAGTGSYGAIPVRTAEQIRSWISYWEQMRFVPPDSFTLSEYLPGRDYCVQCLWDRGRLVLAKMAERIVYLPSGSPSGVSSTPALAKTVFYPEVVDTCAKAIRALDPEATGICFVDLKENEDGVACITEINAGRFATMTNIHDLTGTHNMAQLFVRVAMGEAVHIPGASDYAADYYLVRSVDTVPFIVHGDTLGKNFQPVSVA